LRLSRTGVATVVSEGDSLARRRGIERRHGPTGRLDGMVSGVVVYDPLTIRIELGLV
jgi:hypothetical protein